MSKNRNETPSSNYRVDVANVDDVKIPKIYKSFRKANLDPYFLRTNSRLSKIRSNCLIIVQKSTNENWEMKLENFLYPIQGQGSLNYDFAVLIEVKVPGNQPELLLSEVLPNKLSNSTTYFSSWSDVLEGCRYAMDRFNYHSVNVSDSFLNVIEFSPESMQAGVQILNYFQETLNQKYPDNEVTVRIGQKGNIVTMEIETSDGEIELYEKALKEYGLVVAGQKPVEEYLPDKLDQMALEFRLKNISTELEYTNKLLTMKDQVIGGHERTIDGLNEQILKLTSAYINLSERLADITEKAIESDDMQPVFTILDEKLKSSSIEDFREELEAFKAEKPTLWEAIQTHAYKIAEKAVYTQGSTELINLLTQI